MRTPPLVGLLLLMQPAVRCARHPLVVEGEGTADLLTYTFPGEDERTLRNPDVPCERMGNRKGTGRGPAGGRARASSPARSSSTAVR